MFKKNFALLAIMFAVACGGAETPAETTPEPVEPAPVAEVAPEPEPVAEDPADVRIVGDHLEIDGHINFESDAAVLVSDSMPLIDHIALLLSHHSGDIGHLRVVGHTDAAGGHDHNQELSEQRAAAVVEALRERGVTAVLDSSGVGEEAPICQDDTEECHASNRRVEFIIVPATPAP